MTKMYGGVLLVLFLVPWTTNAGEGPYEIPQSMRPQRPGPEINRVNAFEALQQGLISDVKYVEAVNFLNVQGRTALMSAIAAGDNALVELELYQISKANTALASRLLPAEQYLKIINARDEYSGLNALGSAVMSGKIEIVKNILKLVKDAQKFLTKEQYLAIFENIDSTRGNITTEIADLIKDAKALAQ